MRNLTTEEVYLFTYENWLSKTKGPKRTKVCELAAVVDEEEMVEKTTYIIQAQTSDVGGESHKCLKKCINLRLELQLDSFICQLTEMNLITTQLFKSFSMFFFAIYNWISFHPSIQENNWPIHWLHTNYNNCYSKPSERLNKKSRFIWFKFGIFTLIIYDKHGSCWLHNNAFTELRKLFLFSFINLVHNPYSLWPP